MNPEKRRAGSLRRRLVLWALCIGGLAVAGELTARYGLGLGDPPLYEFAPGVEYLQKPGTYRRFGNTVKVNSRHMRSDEFSEHKSDTNELRVMILGDSVVNGGGLTDQRELASEIIRQQLAESMGRPVTVGNISAGSWGPGNLLAYVRRFGLCDADVVVIVLNSEDIGDNPNDNPTLRNDSQLPAHTPWTAIGELFGRYVKLRLMKCLGLEKSETGPIVDPREAETRSLRDLGDLCDDIARVGAKIVIVHFPNRSEVAGPFLPGADVIGQFVAARGIPLCGMRPAIGAAIEGGIDPYRPNDTIHPNAEGQRILARETGRAIQRVMKAPVP